MNQRRIESRAEVSAYLARLNYALDHGAQLRFQKERRIDNSRNERYTNSYTTALLFPDKTPETILRQELKYLTIENYIGTVSDSRFPDRGDLWEFGKIYNLSDEVYIKLRIQIADRFSDGEHTVFIMSFHFAEIPFSEMYFPYQKSEIKEGAHL